MAKATHASVTEERCSCNYLQDSADDPSNPIVFDAETSEYQFSCGDGAMLVIYHCPFCGGAAPESKRAALFALISEAEESRLAKLLHGVETIEAAVKKLGKPDFEGTSASKYAEGEGRPPRIEHHRDLRYYNLSPDAEIWITERPDGKIFWSLQGKFVGADRAVNEPTASFGGKRPFWRLWS